MACSTRRATSGHRQTAEQFGFGEIRIAHEQNIVLPDVPKADLYPLWRLACEQGLGSANIGLLTDIIACPGGDFCALANAKSIPIAQAIQARFEDLDYLHDLDDISLNISGCIARWAKSSARLAREEAFEYCRDHFNDGSNR